MKPYIKASVVSLALVVSGVLVSPSAQVQIQRGFSTAYNLTVQNLALFADGTESAPSITFASDTNTGVFRPFADYLGLSAGGSHVVSVNALGMELGTTRYLAWGDIAAGAAPTLVLTYDAANTLALRNGTTAQKFRVYNTFTDASNYERAELTWDTNVAYVQTVAGGTGTARRLRVGTGSNAPLGFITDGAERWELAAAGHFLASTDNTYDIGASGATRPRNYFGAGSITSAGPTGGVGYATGAGGAVTQITSKATGVTLNTVTGNITMEAGSLAANTAVSFTLTDSAIAATDLVVVTHHSGGTAGAYTVVGQAAAGSAVITLRNVTAGALAEAVVLKFAVIKGATS